MKCTADTLLWCILTLLKLSYAAVYTDNWALEIEGGEEAAKAVAKRNGFTYIDQVSKCMNISSWHVSLGSKCGEMFGNC